MNRKQRRAALKQSPPAPTRGDPAGNCSRKPSVSQQQNQLAEAARLYKRLLLLRPDHAEAHNNLGRVLHAQGKLTEASAHFAQALTLMPQLFEQFGGICATLVGLLPPLGEAMRQANAAWPNRLTRRSTARKRRAFCDRGRSHAALPAAIGSSPRGFARASC